MTTEVCDNAAVQMRFLSRTQLAAVADEIDEQYRALVLIAGYCVGATLAQTTSSQADPPRSTVAQKYSFRRSVR